MRKWTMATLVETSIESTSLPKIKGAVKQPWGNGGRSAHQVNSILLTFHNQGSV